MLQAGQLLKWVVPTHVSMQQEGEGAGEGSRESDTQL